MSVRRTLAFFDLDRTLIPFNSAFRYAIDEWREGKLPTLRFLESAAMIGLYHLSLVDMEAALTRAAAYYRGIPAAELDRSTRTWFDRRLRDALLPGAVEALARHREKGDLVVLHTSSSCWLAEAASEAWGIDAWIANRFQTDATGRLTGALLRPISYGRGKLTLARAFAETHGAALDDAWFYTDSASDAPLLAAVGHPRVVRPDPRLSRLAAREGWPRVDW